ncbi:5-formyltetrahydrofolate cyclo-ligase [Pseudodesulfovibrio tunisiensis]|uniref:5-formyltetrahydrofolate cyclo-ligase n=1 Tax=Pseudodesulfovibrio tunisiensis TaxID=463192 RepID=UPI001FB22702|nr:5-formyltetrahydrofolate cyclo-ligase [Pseudodesulfovibrio tunisiensis]
MKSKGNLRKSLLDRRQGLTHETVREASLRVVERIRSLDAWRNAREVLLYWPVRNEPDIRPLMADLWQREVRVLLPRCIPDRPGEMDLACVNRECDLTPGMYSIMEPDAEACPAVQSCCPDMVLVPGVGFDRHGFRLGFGGGYYDRLLASEDFCATVSVGIAHDFQLVDELPTEEWDQPVTLVCTDRELWRP